MCYLSCVRTYLSNPRHICNLGTWIEIRKQINKISKYCRLTIDTIELHLPIKQCFLQQRIKEPITYEVMNNNNNNNFLDISNFYWYWVRNKLYILPSFVQVVTKFIFNIILLFYKAIHDKITSTSMSTRTVFDNILDWTGIFVCARLF